MEEIINNSTNMGAMQMYVWAESQSMVHICNDISWCLLILRGCMANDMNERFG